jgi:hypothetical protein
MGRLARIACAVVLATATLVSTVSTASPAGASAVPRRLAAWSWAVSQRGDPYQWGSTGPGSYDCSGLVYEAYLHQGVDIGRDTYSMLASPRLVRIPASQARRGDLAFFGTGHVEIYARPGWTFGALNQGTVVWWHRYGGWWTPSAFYRLRLCHPAQDHPARPLPGGVLEHLKGDRVKQAPAALVQAGLGQLHLARTLASAAVRVLPPAGRAQDAAVHPLPDGALLDPAQPGALLGVHETVRPGDPQPAAPPGHEKSPAPGPRSPVPGQSYPPQ